MHKIRLSKTLLALAASGVMACAIANPSNEAPQNNAATSNAAFDFNAETKQLLEQWVADLNKAFPTSNYSLVDVQTQGNQSTATIRTEAVSDTGYGEPIVIASESKIKIDHGLTPSELGVGVAKIEWMTALGKDTNDEILEALGTESFIQGQGIITLDGDIHATLKSPAGFKKDFDNTYISIPSYEGTFDSFNARATGNASLKVPTIEILSTSPYSKDSGFIMKNFQFTMTDRPIKTGYWEFAGTSSGSIEQMEFKEDGKAIVTIKQIQFSEKGSIDDKKLYSDTFSISGQAAFEPPVFNKTVKIDNFKMEGSIDKFPIEPYLELVKTIQKGSFQDTEKLEALGMQLATPGPSINVDKLSVTINGKEGYASLKMSVGAASAEEQQMPIALLLAQKFKVDASIDIPEAWLPVFVRPGAMEDAEEALKQGEQEGYLTRKNGRIQSSFKYEMGNMSINGKPFKGLGGLPF